MEKRWKELLQKIATLDKQNLDTEYHKALLKEFWILGQKIDREKFPETVMTIQGNRRVPWNKGKKIVTWNYKRSSSCKINRA